MGQGSNLLSKSWTPTILIVAGSLPILYVGLPLLHLLSSTSLQQVFITLRNQEFLQSVMTTLFSATVSTGISVVFGLPTAFLLSGKSFIGKNVLEGLLLIPLVLPPIVGGISLLSFFGPYSGIGSWFSGQGIELSNSLVGVVLAQLYITSPFVILSAKSGFEEIPKEYREATKIAGGGTWEIFWYISLPIARRAIATGAALTFARAVGEFGATMMMAYHPYTVPVDIWVQFSSGGLNAIVPMAVIIVLAIIIILLCGGAIRKKYNL